MPCNAPSQVGGRGQVRPGADGARACGGWACVCAVVRARGINQRSRSAASFVCGRFYQMVRVVRQVEGGSAGV